MLAGTRRRPLRWILIGVASYLIALVALLPARMLFDPGADWAITGTVWHGQAVLDGAYRVDWRWAPLRSLGALAFAADWRMDGEGTALGGVAKLSARRLLLEDVVGQADAALLTALTPSMPLACHAALTVDLPRLLIAGSASTADGEIRGEAGSCTRGGSADTVALPALVARAAVDRSGVTTATLAPLGERRLHLVEGSFAGGRLSLAATAAADRVLPFLRGFRFERNW